MSRLSPPLGSLDVPERATPSPARSGEEDDFELPVLDLPWERNANGDWVRTSNGSPLPSSLVSIAEQLQPEHPPSPVLSNAAAAKRPSLLSRSETVPTLNPSPTATSRQFTRAISNPLASSSSGLHSTPAAPSTRLLPPSAGLTSTGRKIGRARRVKIEDYNNQAQTPRTDVEEKGAMSLRSSLSSQAQKENGEAHGTPIPIPSSTVRPLADVVPLPQQQLQQPRSLSMYGRQVLPVPARAAARLIKKVDSIPESPDAEEDLPQRSRTPSGLSKAAAPTRPRRSYSLSDTAPGEDQPPGYQQFLKLPSARGARRVTFEEKAKKEEELAREREVYPLSEADESAEELERRAMELVNAHAPPMDPPHGSPTHVGPYRSSLSTSTSMTAHLHGRQDSETVMGSPTAVDSSSSGSGPLGRKVSSTSTATAMKHRRSPPPQEQHFQGERDKDGFAVPSIPTWDERERRSASDEHLRLNGANGNVNGNGNGYGGERDPYGNAMMPPQNSRQPQAVPLQSAQSMPNVVAQQQQQQQQQQNMIQLPQLPGGRNNQIIPCNRRGYIRLDLIGKGGSSKVYRVMAGANEVYAMKRVSLDKTDNEGMASYMNEIALLKRLEGNRRIIRLIDSEVRGATPTSKGYLTLVMELGEIDMARLLQEQQQEPMDLVWVSYYWKQMLQAVHVLHEEKIVHSDLKPANFVLVKGQLKLIDFGIANAIANDTTNIQRDHQIGTLNYMSPEAIELGEGMRRLKVGRPSDVWSLGCILYQMIYGSPPFYHITNPVFKMRAIPDANHVIQFPSHSSPPPPRPSKSGETPSPPKPDKEIVKVPVPKDVVWAMMSCLKRNPKDRATIPELLGQDWLTMRERTELPQPPPRQQDLESTLGEAESVINQHFMTQLLKFGINLGMQSGMLDEETLAAEGLRLVKELKRIRAEVVEATPPAPSPSATPPPDSSDSEAEDGEYQYGHQQQYQYDGYGRS